jgi:hypothetical protein
VIWTEHEWDNIVELDILLGSSGNFTQGGKKDIKHGSDKYHKSPLSQEAYSKLCCALENKILIYKDILDQALNLSPEQKEESMNVVKDKCGIDKATSWLAWKTTCKDQLALDQEVLTKNWDKIMPACAAATVKVANDNKHLPYPPLTTMPSASNTNGATMINVSATVSKPNFKATTKDLLRSSEQGLDPIKGSLKGGLNKNSTVKKNTNSGAVPDKEEEEEEEQLQKNDSNGEGNGDNNVIMIKRVTTAMIPLKKTILWKERRNLRMIRIIIRMMANMLERLPWQKRKQQQLQTLFHLMMIRTLMSFKKRKRMLLINSQRRRRKKEKRIKIWM